MSESSETRSSETGPSAEALFVTAANQAPVLVWVSSVDDGWVFCNATWLRFTGRRFADELGRGWLDGVHPEDRDACVETYDAALARREPFEMEFRLRRADGAYRWVLGWGVPRYDDHGVFLGYLGSGADVTTQAEARENLAAREAEARLALDVGGIGAWRWKPSTNEVFWSPELEALVGLDEGAFEGTLEAFYARVHPEDRVLAAEQIERAVSIGGELRFEYRIVRSDGSLRWLQAIGRALPSTSGTDPQWIGVAIDITERTRSERMARLVGRATELVAASPDFDRVVDLAARVVVPDLADSCHVYVRADVREPRRVGVAHIDGGVEQRLRVAAARFPIVPESHPVLGAVLARTEPILVPDVTRAVLERAARSEVELEFLELHDARSIIMAPLRVGDRTLGSMSVSYTTASGRRYGDDDVPVIAEVARRVALAIDNARLAREAERGAERLDLLARTSELLTLELDSEVRATAMARVSVPAFADVCAVYLREGHDHARLVAFAHVDPRAEAAFESIDEWPGIELDASDPPAVAMRENRVVVVPEVTDEHRGGSELDGRAAAVARTLGIRSRLAVPLLGPDGPIGALGFGYAGSGRRYSESDVPLALDLARRSGPAVDNARRFEQEQATAAALQRSLLPERLPEVPELTMTARYLPGSEGLKVGGDWYDVVRMRDGRVALAIGDVVGHGIRAAATMGRFRHALDFCLFDGTGSAAATIERVNRYLAQAPAADMATLLVLLLDPDTGAVQYASAGHLPAIVRSRDGSIRWLEGGRGIPLGVAESVDFAEAEDRLEPGDLLVLYTDGLVERRTEALDEGLERLAVVVADQANAQTSPDAIADRIVDQLLGSRSRADDVALLVARFDREHQPLDLRIRADAGELSGLRSKLRAWLTRAGCEDGLRDEIVLATNEFAGNAVEHAYGLGDDAFAVRVELVADVVEVVVEDHGIWRPAGVGEHRGRGLELARELMDDVAIDIGPSGTVVRATRRVTRVVREEG